MRFLLDESAEFRIVAFLQEQGHDVCAIAHDYPHALQDEAVLTIAQEEGRILITNNRDFGQLVVSQQRPHAGVIYFRLPAATVQLKAEVSQFSGAACGYKRDNRLSRQGMFQHAGIDHGGLHRIVGAERGDDGQAVIGGCHIPNSWDVFN